MNFHLKKTNDQLIVWSSPDLWIYFRGFGLLALNLFISITLIATTQNWIGPLLISTLLTPFIIMIFYNIIFKPSKFTLNREGQSTLKKVFTKTTYNQPSEVWTNYEFIYGFGGSSIHILSIHATIDSEETVVWSSEIGYFEQEQGKHTAINAALYELGFHPPVTTTFDEKGNIDHIGEPVFNIEEKQLNQPLNKIIGDKPQLIFGDLRDKKFGIWFYFFLFITASLFTPWVTNAIRIEASIVISIPIIIGLLWRIYKWAKVNIYSKTGRWSYGIICTPTHFIDRPGHTLSIIPRECMTRFHAKADPKNPYCASVELAFKGVHGFQNFSLEENIIYDTTAEEMQNKVREWIGSN